jgi:hypothetical protein
MGRERMVALALCAVAASNLFGTMSPGVVEATATMSVARAAHTATALTDGRVLVAGGFTEKGSPRGAEAYEASTGRFSALPPMLTTRHSHTATMLPGGKVLIAGGYGEGTTTLTSAELFDPATNTFAPTGPLGSARADHVAVLLANGMVLIAGGLGPDWTFLASAEVYDPATGRFSPTGAMTVARESHTAVRLRDGRVLVAGGHVGRRAALRLHGSAETYDPVRGVFTRVGDMRVRRHKHDAVRLATGHVLITGGSDERDSDGMYDSSELFDPSTGAFTLGPTMQRPRYKHAGTSVVLDSGLVLVAGGAPQAETYDPKRRQFAVVAGDAGLAGRFSAVAPLVGGGAVITGGYGARLGPQASAWVYRP